MAVLTATYIRAHPEDAHKEAASDARRQSATMKPGEAAAGSVECVRLFFTCLQGSFNN